MSRATLRALPLATLRELAQTQLDQAAARHGWPRVHAPFHRPTLIELAYRPRG